MGSNVAKYNVFVVLVHWALALFILLLLGSGWYIQYMSPPAEARAYLRDLHISLGLTAALLALIQIFSRIAFGAPPFPDGFAAWRRISSNILNIAIYIFLIILLASGYLREIFSATPVKFWGYALPAWGVADPTLAGFFASAHKIAGFALAGAIVAHIGIIVVNIFEHQGFASRMLLGAAPKPLALALTNPSFSLRAVQHLASDLRLFGWIEFWLQLAFALSSALLLAFATSGRVFSPSSSAFGDAIYWSGYGFLLLCIAVVLAFYYTRAARKVLSKPESYLRPKNRAAFWFLWMGLFVGSLGALASFIGVALSISLLIAKTVSQPPGIAITDPNKIIRALDVFVLLVNFILLMAHSIGTGATLWLGLRALKARLDYSIHEPAALLPQNISGRTG